VSLSASHSAEKISRTGPKVFAPFFRDRAQARFSLSMKEFYNNTIAALVIARLPKP
jgi:hypothetical protein